MLLPATQGGGLALPRAAALNRSGQSSTWRAITRVRGPDAAITRMHTVSRTRGIGTALHACRACANTRPRSPGPGSHVPHLDAVHICENVQLLVLPSCTRPRPECETRSSRRMPRRSRTCEAEAGERHAAREHSLQRVVGVGCRGVRHTCQPIFPSGDDGGCKHRMESNLPVGTIVRLRILLYALLAAHSGAARSLRHTSCGWGTRARTRVCRTSRRACFSCLCHVICVHI